MAKIENNPDSFIKGKWIWFRIKSDSEDKLSKYFSNLVKTAKFGYIYAQYEKDLEHGLHLQAMCYSIKSITSNTFKNLFFPGIPVFGGLKTKSEIIEMDSHVKRKETRCKHLEPLQHGEFPDLTPRQTVLKNMKEARVNVLFQLLEMGKSIHEMEGYANNNNFTLREMKLAKERWNFHLRWEKKEKKIAEARKINWKPWQKFLLEYLEAPIDFREIFVILDELGKTGKLFFAENFYTLNEDITIHLKNGCTANLVLEISNKPSMENILVTLHHSINTPINYQALEQAKDGQLCDTKYLSKVITLDIPRMVIFANKEFNWNAMSLDRYKIMVITGDHYACYNYTEYTQMVDNNMSSHAKGKKIKFDHLEPLQSSEFPDLIPRQPQDKNMNMKEVRVKELTQLLKMGKSVHEMEKYARANNFPIREITLTKDLWYHDLKLEQIDKSLEKARKIKWKPWQKFVLEYLEAPIDSREFFVIIDELGDAGKSYFARNFCALNEDISIHLNNAPTADLMYLISKKPSVKNILVTLHRSINTPINYQALEQAKDAQFCSTKYNSKVIILDIPRIVIFTNNELDWNAMSLDRWKIMVITGDDYACYNYTEYIKMVKNNKRSYNQKESTVLETKCIKMVDCSKSSFNLVESLSEDSTIFEPAASE